MTPVLPPVAHGDTGGRLRADDGHQQAVRRRPGPLRCLPPSRVRRGEIHGLVGENGAGKTTLMNVLYAFAGAQQAVKESGKDAKVFSIIVPRCETAANIVGCATRHSAKLQVAVIKDYLDNKLPAGQPKTFGVEDPEVQAFELCPEWAKRPELASIVQQQTKEINGGTLEMPKGV